MPSSTKVHTVSFNCIFLYFRNVLAIAYIQINRHNEFTLWSMVQQYGNVFCYIWFTRYTIKVSAYLIWERYIAELCIWFQIFTYVYVLMAQRKLNRHDGDICKGFRFARILEQNAQVVCNKNGRSTNTLELFY